MPESSLSHISLCPRCREAYVTREGHECTLTDGEISAAAMVESVNSSVSANWPATVALPGVVSEGTLRVKEDLIPCFGDLLSQINRTKFANLSRSFLGWSEDDELAIEYYVVLTDALNEEAPSGYYFGTIEGDGACFGFFEHDSEDEGTDDQVTS